MILITVRAQRVKKKLENYIYIVVLRNVCIETTCRASKAWSLKVNVYVPLVSYLKVKLLRS